MDGYRTNKKYTSLKIPDRQMVLSDCAMQSSSPTEVIPSTSPNNGMYYEIDYDSYPIPGAGKFVLKSQKIEPIEPEGKDEVRDLFVQMRDISRHYRPLRNNSSNFLDRRDQQDRAFIFYKQGVFMKDFSDNYSGNAQFSQYFPSYQIMNYEQLRTYFTWRSAVRNGMVADTSLSYAFLYIYELLGNIGVSSPQDGLDKLMAFWKAFQVHNRTIDKYMIRWLRDYHVYYELPHSFKAFVTENHLALHYPNVVDTENDFHLFCAISKYDIRKSAFFTDDKVKMVTNCFHAVINTLRQVFLDNGIHFNDSIFEPAKGMTVWTPFQDALFSPWIQQADRRILLSEKEIYRCSHNKWAFSTVITTESGKEFIGYVMKQMEAVLRQATQYKYKLTADINRVTHAVLGKLKEKGVSLETVVTDTVLAFYREATKTIVKVDHQALSHIRKEALATQERLMVPEQDVVIHSIQAPQNPSFLMPQKMPSSHDLSLAMPQTMPPAHDLSLAMPQKMPLAHDLSLAMPQSGPPMPTMNHEEVTVNPDWANLRNALSETELQALSVIIRGNRDIKKFADECGIMLEVLVDGINEKAMDCIGDNLMDDGFDLYDDYHEHVKEIIR